MAARSDFIELLATPELAELGPGLRSVAQSQAALEKQLQPLLKASGLADERQALVRAIILLWHDHLEAAHQIAQEIDNPDGAFVHGIMHRREPDFGNAAYWFRRVGRHPAYPAIVSRVSPILRKASDADLASKLVPEGSWAPFAFIDACEEASEKKDARYRLLQEIQREEFCALLESFF